MLPKKTAQDALVETLDVDPSRVRIDNVAKTVTPSKRDTTTTTVDFALLEEAGKPSSVVLMKQLKTALESDSNALGIPASLKVVSINYAAEYSTFGASQTQANNKQSGSVSITFAVATTAALLVLAL
eukprot:TRINITY_DN6494_c0_g1_i1.p3 TRINITY_DN6494_c0_g1~~TRINITY_DN6494_c0_g1_i1.p3  ORF type:complete len:127 (-),score=28.62 TRINITY_DN6494_c0_g1_i1:53-433(-)